MTTPPRFLAFALAAIFATIFATGCQPFVTPSVDPATSAADLPPMTTKTKGTGAGHEAFQLETPNLFAYNKKEIAALTSEEIQKKNDDEVAAFEKFQPEIRASAKTGGEVSFEQASLVVDEIQRHPVVSPSENKYDRENVKVGYCFGRATFVYLALKKMGLQSSSIRKIWLVGSMRAGSTTWGFHVAPAAFVKGKGWMVLDSNLMRVVSVSEWLDYYRWMDSSNRTRIYMTSPQRFGATIERYSRVDLGLDLPAEKDWYHHYFYDLMAWFRTIDFKALGFERVEPALTSIPASVTDANDIY